MRDLAHQLMRRICTIHLLTIRKPNTKIRVKVMTRYHDHAREWLFERGWTGAYKILTPGGWIYTIDCRNAGRVMIFGFTPREKKLAIEFKTKWGFSG